MAKRQRIRDLLLGGQIRRLFLEELGWDRTPADSVSFHISNETLSFEAVAEKRGFRVFVCPLPNNAAMPTAGERRAIEARMLKSSYEHIIVFRNSTAQMWIWASKEAGRPRVVRTFTLYKGQSGEALVQKLQGISFSLVDEPELTSAGVIQKAASVFDVESVTRRFFVEFKEEHGIFLSSIKGIRRTTDRGWYASIMLNRLMFIYFIQWKGFLSDDRHYLRHKFEALANRKPPAESFYKGFLLKLCHEGLGSVHHSPELRHLLGNVTYINGGLFEPHRLERAYGEIDIEDSAFSRVFDFFDRYDWHLDVRPNATGDEINPDVLGYIFENFVNQQEEMGAFYTKEDVSQYVVLNTIVPALIRKVSERTQAASLVSAAITELIQEDAARYALSDDGAVDVPLTAASTPGEVSSEVAQSTINGVQLILDTIESARSIDIVLMLFDALKAIRILDPTCGSGAFLFAALNVLHDLYDACVERLERALVIQDPLTDLQRKSIVGIINDVKAHSNRDYYVLKSAIVQNLFGVDIMEEAVEICKLRLFLKLVAQIDDIKHLEPLPDIDFNVRAGNTLVGFAKFGEVEDASRRQRPLTLGFDDQLKNLDRLAVACEREFSRFRSDQMVTLDSDERRKNKVDLASHLAELSAALDKMLYDDARRRRPIDAWLRDVKPFHWCAEFYGVLNNGGFDVIIGNPPFVKYTKVKDQYEVTGYHTGQSGNLYAMVVERSLQLLRPDGQFGMIVPLSVTFSRDFVSLRKLLLDQRGMLRYASFDNIPDRLFTGVKESDNTSKANQQRITILTLDRAGQPRVFGTALLRWKAAERERLFAELPFVDMTEFCSPEAFPKIGRRPMLEFWEQWQAVPQTIGAYIKTDGANSIVVPRTAGYYVSAYPAELDRTKQMVLHFRNRYSRDLAFMMINSNLFFWRWRVLGDAFDVTSGVVLECPIPLLSESEVKLLSAELFGAVNECSTFKMYRKVRVPNVNFNKRLDILYRIDEAFIRAIAPGTNLTPRDFAWAKSNSFLEFDVPKSNDENAKRQHGQRKKVASV